MRLRRSMLFCAALQIRLYICLTDDVVSSSLRHEVGMGGGGWWGTEAVSSTQQAAPVRTGCCSGSFLRKAWQNTFLPSPVPGKDGVLLTKGEKSSVCGCVCVCVVLGKEWGCWGVLRLFPRPLCQRCVHARVCSQTEAFMCVWQLCGGS